MSTLELLDRAAGATMCDVLDIAGETMLNMGIWSAATGVGAKPGLALMGLGTASLLANNYLCEPIDLGNALIPEVEGCRKVDGHGIAQIYDGVGRWFNPWQNNTDEYKDMSLVATEITANYVQQAENGWNRITKFKTELGELEFWSFYNATNEAPPPSKARILVTEGSCAEEGPGTTPPPPELYEPIPYTDVDTNCQFNVTFQGFFEETAGGPVRPVLLIEGTQEQRASGSRMGGCNFNPTIYIPPGGGGGGDGPYVIPGPDGPLPPFVPPGGGTPWWWAPLLAGSTSAALNLIGEALKEALGPTLPEGSFTLQAPCDKDEDGNALTQTWTYPEQKVQERMIAHQITQLEALQTHLNWKTPICNEQPPGEGDWRTISFISTETSPYGKSRLRKRFRYRSTSGWELGSVVDHWKDFTWSAGPVCVKHLGASWGTPTVWADSIDEGKRVIRHAAADAGIDPDQVGRWTVSGSSSPRIGVSRTMIVNTKGGYWWITARDGSNGKPLVAT